MNVTDSGGRKRRSRRIAVLIRSAPLLLVLAMVLVLTAPTNGLAAEKRQHTSTAPQQSPVGTRHTIYCSVTAWNPYRTITTTAVYVNGVAEVYCTPTAPDIMNTTVRLLYYNSGWRVLAESTTAHRGTHFYVTAVHKCAAPYTYWSMKTEAFLDVFHGNWLDLYDASSVVSVAC